MASASITSFVYNEVLWAEIKSRVAKAKRVRAAIAYLGKDGANLLPLKNGDCLVVDMSLGAVRQGMTCPQEIQQLMTRGVRVFSRGSLHAKFVMFDNTLIAGSANVSRNSNEILDEAGIVTTDVAAVRRARDFFEQLCSEPVGKHYLKKCIAEYRPPHFKPAIERARPRAKSSRRIKQAKLWFIGGLVVLNLSDDAERSIKRVERRVHKRSKQPERTEVSWIRYGRMPKFLNHIRVGDWVVDCMKDGNARYVGPPAQVLGQEEWISPLGKCYTMMMLEQPINGESMILSNFRKRVNSIEPSLNHQSPRTKPILDNACADAILRMWTASGKSRKATALVEQNEVNYMSDCISAAPMNLGVFIRNDLAYGLWDGFPVTDLHALVIPQRHASDYFDLTKDELMGCDALLREMREMLIRRDASIAGFNIGANVGLAAGQTVFHCHLHLIPRRTGDVENPRGGVRHIIPSKGAY